MKSILVCAMALVFLLHPTQPEWYRAILYQPTTTATVTMMPRFAPTLGFAPEAV